MAGGHAALNSTAGTDLPSLESLSILHHALLELQHAVSESILWQAIILRPRTSLGPAGKCTRTVRKSWYGIREKLSNLGLCIVPAHTLDLALRTSRISESMY